MKTRRRRIAALAVAAAGSLMLLAPFATTTAGASAVASVPMQGGESSSAIQVTVRQDAHPKYGLTATITWTASANPPGGWTVARDGKDTGGTGAWSASIPGTARSHTFNYLIPGQTYNLTIKSAAGEGTVRVVAGATDLAATVAQAKDSTYGLRATLRWISETSAGAWVVSRDGKDTGGTGNWSTEREAQAREHTFNYLVPGQTYNLTVRNTADGRSATVTVIAGQASPSELTATATQKGANQATLRWTTGESPASWRVGRDGRDAGGTGAWSTSVPGTVREHTFNHLIPGNTYTLTAIGSDGRIATTTITMSGANNNPSPAPSQPSQPPAAPTTPAPVAPSTPAPNTPATGDWLSGTATQEKGNTDPGKYFGDWRGTPIEIGQTWPNTLDMWGVNPSIADSWGNFSGPMSVSLAPGVDKYGKAIDQNGHKGWRGWKALANGENDSWWREAARNLKKLRAGKGTTFVSPMYEFNGDWMAWSVNGDAAAFKAGWERMARIWKEEYPESKLVLPAACNRGVPDSGLPNPNSYDIFGCTIYNAWPWEANGGATIANLEKARQQALKAGKPIGITEWANSANGGVPGGGGDAPGFMTAMNSWMKANAGAGAGQLVFETFFNIDGYALDHMLLKSDGSVSSTQKNTAAEYQRLW